MPKVTFAENEQIRSVVPFEVGNLQMFSSATAAEGSPFAGLGFKADSWKAYVEFEICHSLPNIIGPVQEGNYVGYTAETLAMSHTGLMHQQMNLRHLLKAYDPKNITRDRIVGCVVATWFPKAPLGGWKMGASGKQAPAIKAVAVVFKLAEGVNSMLGQHMASREKQSVSIESITSLSNIGLWRPSVPDQVVPLLDAGEMESCISRSESGNLVVGEYQGEQVVMIYGTGKPVDFRGVGFTPRPAETAAEITSINAEMDGGDLHAIAAEAVDRLMVGETIRFRTGRTGIVREIVTKGTAQGSCGVRMQASPKGPVMRVEVGGKIVLRRI